ncbi:hypothetical protein GGS23DRAFT_562854 [Durotheca rogersii]|uniref:uncharacterized protein n=1 Tax=Durotheca rogersii TaxID=419775 RepID=UPI00221EEA5B|nr:uncharacterized protein GGS23DRAFT_562854 [Durotheca rogersii]KAI5864088.1 hypothetical protein GGS23DRAFT_562854 [Durotheca rogersii]
MPPKRRSSGSGSSEQKKAKTPEDEPPRSERWAAVSGSANADADYKTTWKNPDRWYSFVTICPLDDDDDDESDTDNGDRKDPGRTKCGEGNCFCLKPVAENPDHPWIISQAGYRKHSTLSILMSLRNPDNFDMYTFNDHCGYGALEVVQNVLLDYVEAAGRGWREQWAVCEGLALWLICSGSNFLTTVGDSEYVNETFRLIGRMFLNMLAELDKKSLLGDATDVKSIGTTMAMYLEIMANARASGALEEVKKNTSTKFNPGRSDDAILTYANQRGVTLQGPRDVDELTAGLNGDIELPSAGAGDLWGWKAGLKRYETKYAKVTVYVSKKNGVRIGGDALDITTWTSAKRKAANFDKKDPLGKREMDAIKNGLVIQLG